MPDYLLDNKTLGSSYVLNRKFEMSESTEMLDVKITKDFVLLTGPDFIQFFMHSVYK